MRHAPVTSARRVLQVILTAWAGNGDRPIDPQELGRFQVRRCRDVLRLDVRRHFARLQLGRQECGRWLQALVDRLADRASANQPAGLDQRLEVVADLLAAQVGAFERLADVIQADAAAGVASHEVEQAGSDGGVFCHAQAAFGKLPLMLVLTGSGNTSQTRGRPSVAYMPSYWQFERRDDAFWQTS